MAKQKDSIRTGWTKAATPPQRAEISRAAGSSEQQTRRPSSGVKRMGPYETSYQIDFGYTQNREIM